MSGGWPRAEHFGYLSSKLATSTLFYWDNLHYQRLRCKFQSAIL